MNIELTRQLTVFDLESTGANPENDRIVQISITVLYPDKESKSWSTLINPGIPIPSEVSAIHGILDAHVAEAPKVETVLPSLVGTAMHLNRDFAGYNVLFDLKLFRAECLRAKIAWDWERSDAAVVDAFRIYQIKHPRTLQDAYKEYVDRDGFTGAHDASADVQATIDVLFGQLERHPDLPRTPRELSEFCFPRKKNSIDREGKFVWRNGVACLGFGRHNGKPLVEAQGYLRWMLTADFSAEVKDIARAALAGEYPRR